MLEIDERTNILQPGQTVIDCGASPGSWTEIAVEKTNANGKQKNVPKGFVIGIDLRAIHPIEVSAILVKLYFSLSLFLIHSFFGLLSGSSHTEPIRFHTKRDSRKNSSNP